MTTPLALHNLRAAPHRTKKRVGRGNASGRGTTAGRGTKGQRARTGGSNRLQQHALRQLFSHLPKMGGFKSRTPKPVVVSLTDLARHFAAGAEVTPALLLRKRMMKPGQQVKILASGTIDRPLKLRGCLISAAAKTKIEAAGGSIAE